MRLIPVIALPAVAIVALSGCAFVPHGPVVSEKRDIAAATAIELDTSGNVTIRQGEPSLVIHAPREALERLNSTVKDGVLVLGVKNGVPGFLVGNISYEVTLPSLKGLELNGSGNIDSDLSGAKLDIDLSGSGNVDITGIDASSVTLDISGSGDVDLAGRADEFSASIGGSGHVRADDLKSTHVSIDLGGSGDLDVAASDTLDVSISGSGSVSYVGRPEISEDISGSGEVSAS